MDVPSPNRQDLLTKSRLESHLFALGSGDKSKASGGFKCGRSEWGGETAFSHDSGWASADFNDAGGSFGGEPDLLDCLILEDVEERIQQIKLGAAKPSEMICLKNLIGLLNIQNEEPKVRVKTPATVPSNMRAIIGSGGASNNISSYHNDLKILLEQEAPLTFPGQMPPVTVKLLPPGHPPAERQRISATHDIPDLFHASVAASRGSEYLVPSYQSKQTSTRISKSRKPTWDHSRDVSLRIGEGFYQLRLLQKERSYCEDLFRISFGVPFSKNSKTQRRSLNDKSLNDLLLAVQDEMEAILIFVKSIEAELKKRNLIKTMFEAIEIWSSKLTQVMDHSRISRNGGGYGSREFIEKLKYLNICTRQVRTAIFAILPGPAK